MSLYTFSVDRLRYRKKSMGDASRKGSAGPLVAGIIILVVVIIVAINIVNYIDPSVFTQQTPGGNGLGIYNVYPVQGQILPTRNVVVSAEYSDGVANITSVSMWLDGVNVTREASVNGSELAYSGILDEGTHSILMVVNDSRGVSVSKSWSFSVNLTVGAVVIQVLNTINSARRALGISNVSLLEPVASGYRAQDMAAKQYFGHYDLNGIFPSYYYTQLGGLYAMEENIGYDYNPITLSYSDVMAAVNQSVYTMIYDDAIHGFGHRDSILDPTNNCVDISVANDSNRVYLVIHMIKEWVTWQDPPAFINGTFSCSGMLDLNGSGLTDVLIYYSNPAMHGNYTYDPSMHSFTGEQSYSIGTGVAGVLPSPQSYVYVETLRPTNWSVDGQNFSFAFQLGAINGSGIYTISLWANNTLVERDPLNPDRYSDTLPVLLYTVSLP